MTENPVTDERIARYLSMPTLDGHVVSLFFVPPGKLAAYERKWGEWFRANPDRRHWPEWCERWIEHRKRG
jgi:hypothetical protein